MDKGEIVGAIIGILLLILYVLGCIKEINKKDIKEKTFVNLTLENQRLKATIQDLEERN